MKREIRRLSDEMEKYPCSTCRKKCLTCPVGGCALYEPTPEQQVVPDNMIWPLENVYVYG